MQERRLCRNSSSSLHISVRNNCIYTTKNYTTKLLSGQFFHRFHWNSLSHYQKQTAALHHHNLNLLQTNKPQAPVLHQQRLGLCLWPVHVTVSIQLQFLFVRSDPCRVQTSLSIDACLELRYCTYQVAFLVIYAHMATCGGNHWRNTRRGMPQHDPRLRNCPTAH